MGSSYKNRARSGSVKISDSDIKLLSEQGSAVVAYYDKIGIVEIKNRASGLIFSSILPLIGLLFLGWSTVAMIVYLVCDAVITFVADLFKYLIAPKHVTESHRLDQLSGKVLLISDGLEDGTGSRADTGDGTSPLLIFLFGGVSTIFMAPVVALTAETFSQKDLIDILQEPIFPIFIGIEFCRKFFSAIFQAIVARQNEIGQKFIVLESGGTAVLYAGLLILVWLPIMMGQIGFLLMFLVINLIRIGFGTFALYWTPKALRVLKRRVDNKDYTLKPK